MSTGKFEFEYEEYESAAQLSPADEQLLSAAKRATEAAYAPFSKFRVGAAAEMFNGEIITGSNQENASFPAGLCAEGVALAVAAARFPDMPIRSMAISYQSPDINSDHPVAPCGICRQSLQEFRVRTGNPIRLIMGGMKGKVIVVNDASLLLPFSFRF